MKKRLFNLLFLCAVACMASAETLTVADVEIMQGKTANFEITIGVDGNNYTGLQFDMIFPKGFATTKGKELKADWKEGSINPGLLNSEGKGTVTCYTMDNTSFIPDGVFGTIEFSVDESVAVGEYDVTLSSISFFTSTVRKDISDVTFKVKVVDAITLDENATTAPSAASGVNVNVKRTLTGGNWSTICVPFDMSEAQVKSAFGEGVKIGDFVSYTSETDDADNVTTISVQFDEVKEIEANRPYVIKVASDIPEFKVEGVDIVVDEPYAEYTNGRTGSRKEIYGTFEGTYVANTSLPANSLFLNSGKFWYSTGSNTMKGFRAFFNFVDVLSAVEGAASRINITFDDVTAIKGIKTDGEEEIYTLSGQRVNKAGKGVYIVNGKKVIKK